VEKGCGTALLVHSDPIRNLVIPGRPPAVHR